MVDKHHNHALSKCSPRVPEFYGESLSLAETVAHLSSIPSSKSEPLPSTPTSGS